MSFSKRYNLEPINAINFKLSNQGDKRQNYNLQSTKSRKESFSDGFYASENQNQRKIQTENKTH